MYLRLFLSALVVCVICAGQSRAQSVAQDGLRGSSGVEDGFSDDDQDTLIGESRTQSTTASGRTANRTTRPNPNPRRQGADATRRTDGRPQTPQTPRAVQPVQPSRRAADGTAGERRGGDQTASIPEDNFDDDQDAYQPLGLRAGSFVLRSSIESTVGASDNVSRDNGGQSGGFYRLRPQITINSDWTRHQLDITLRGDYNGYFDDTIDDEPSFEATAVGRIDIRDGTRLDLESGYQYEVEDPSSAEIGRGGSAAGTHTLTGTAGVTQDIRRFETTLRGTVTREIYTAGTGGGGTAATDDRDNTLGEGSLRVAYRVSPALKPFIEGSLFRRSFDQEVDSGGFRRSSKGYSLRGGADFNLGPKITGNLSAGWRSEKLNDRRFDPLEGPTVDGTITWSPSRLTTISLTGSTSFDVTTIASSPGSVQYEGTLALARSLRRNLRLDASAGTSYRDYQSSPITEWRRTASVALEWSLNRNVAAVARYSYEDLDSSTRNADYRSNSVEVGLTLRH